MLKNILQNKILVPLGILIIALIPRVLLLRKAAGMGLGVDDLQSAVHAFQPVDQLLKSVKAFDPHPPLFYLQLHYWEKAGTSDVWLMLNPFLWSTLAVLSLYFLGKKVFGFPVGVLAAVLFALSPVAVAYSVGLRMYAFLILASIWVWFFTHQFFLSNNRWAAGAGIFISTLVFLYSQGAGFIILPSGLVYAALLAAKSWRRNWKVLARYLVLQGIIILLYIPWLLRAGTIHLVHPRVPGLADITQTFAQLLFGFASTRSEHVQVIYILAVIIFLLLSIVLLAHKSSSKMALSFVFIPLAACFVISHLVEPIWLTRTLVHVTPFISLGMALVIMDWIRDRGLVRAHRFRFLCEMGMIVVFVLGAVLGLVNTQHKYYPWCPLKGSAEIIQKNRDAVDVVYIPDERKYWGWSWYFFGPGRVTPITTNYLTTQDGITVVSRPSVAMVLDETREKHRWWVVFQYTDVLGALSPLVDVSDLNPIRKFYDVNVGQVDMNAIPPH